MAPQIAIVYDGVSDPVMGLEWDRPSVELFRTKYPTAIVYSGVGTAAVNLNGSFNEVDSFINSFEAGSTIFCMGGENVIGISKQLTDLGFVKATPEVTDATGFIKSVNYNGRNVFIVTGGCCNTPLLESRQGTINAAYFIFQNGFGINNGDNFAVTPTAHDLHLVSVALKANEINNVTFMCAAGVYKSTLEDYFINQGYAPSETLIIDCWVENSKLNTLLITFGSPSIWAMVAASAVTVLGIVLAGVAIAASAPLSIPTIAFVMTGPTYFALNDALNSIDVAHVEGSKQAAYEAISAPFNLIDDACKGDPKCIDPLLDKATKASQVINDGILAQKKADNELAKIQNPPSTTDDINKLLKSLVAVSVVGTGIYFLIQSGLLTEGAKSVKSKLEDKRTQREASKNATQK